MHAELVVGDNGLLHVADRSSANGTWIDVDRRWERVTQRSVTQHDRVRLGSYVVAVSELLRRAPRRDGVDGGAHTGNRGGPTDSGNRRDTNDLPEGRVRRNPETGEVIAD